MAAQQAFVDGISSAVLTAAIVLILAAAAVALRAPDHPTQETHTDATLGASTHRTHASQ